MNGFENPYLGAATYSLQSYLNKRAFMEEVINREIARLRGFLTDERYYFTARVQFENGVRELDMEDLRVSGSTIEVLTGGDWLPALSVRMAAR